MSNKNEFFACTYCLKEKEGKHMFTTRMQFAGSKIIDILQTVAQCKIPLSTPIKMCAMCTSTLYATSGVMENVVHMVSNLLATNQPQTVEMQKESDSPNSEPEIIEVEVPSIAKATPKKSPPITNGTPTAAKKLEATDKASSPTKQPKSVNDPGTPNVPSGGTPKKQPKELQKSFKENLDDSLKDVIKLTPANEVPKKHKEVTHLFGNSVNNIPDSENGSDEDDDDDVPDLIYECKLCDYKTISVSKYKHHLRENHGQKRPRVLHCSVCHKSFGVMKTLNKHLLTHGIVPKQTNVGAKKDQTKSGDAQLAVLTALKPTTKPKPIINAELTFAIKGTNSSTPKANEEQQQQLLQQDEPIYKCDLCETQTKVAKHLQEHMKSVHNIEKPRIFKCGACPAIFMHKPTRDKHFKAKHCGDQEKATKAPARRKTVDARPAVNIKLPQTAKLPVRRKTVDVRILESPLARKMNELGVVGTPTKQICNEDTHTPVTSQVADLVKPTNSPMKKKSKENVNNEVSTLLQEVFEETASPTKKKSKKDADISIQLDVETIEGSVAGTPKKSKAKKGFELLDHTQLTPIDKKSSKRKSESESQSDVISPVKKSKVEKKKKEESEVIELFEEINSNAIPHKREMLESQSESPSGSQFSCNQCGKMVNTRKRLDSHMRKKHTPLLNCRKCVETFSDSEKFVNHIASCQDSNGLACGVKNCDKIFAAPNFLSSHLKKKHKFD